MPCHFSFSFDYMVVLVPVTAVGECIASSMQDWNKTVNSGTDYCI